MNGKFGIVPDLQWIVLEALAKAGREMSWGELRVEAGVVNTGALEGAMAGLIDLHAIRRRLVPKTGDVFSSLLSITSRGTQMLIEKRESTRGAP